MAYSEGLAEDIRARLNDRPGLDEKQMFGGLAFLVHGNMAVGVAGEELMVRVAKDAQGEAVALPGARMFDLSGKRMRGWVLVSGAGFENDADLESWINRGVAFAEGLPPK